MKDGATDWEATARNSEKARQHLEQRMGAGDAPPPNVDGYKVNVPEALKDTIDAEVLAKDEGFKGFLGKLHAAGASQKIVDAAVATMLERGAAMREAMPMLAMADCVTTLKQQDGWKTDQEYEARVKTAFNAGTQIFGADFAEFNDKGEIVGGLIADYGNDPRLIRGLEAIGREMQEDSGPSPEALQQIDSNLDQLMSSPAYLNANDPAHAATVAKVGALTAQKVGTKPVASGRTHSFKSG